MGYIIACVIGILFGIFGMGLIAASGKYNACKDAYEQGRMDVLKENGVYYE